MPNLKHLLLLGCIGLSPACIDVPPLVEEPPKQDAGAPDADFTFTAVPLQEQVLPGGTLDCDIQLTWTDTTGGAVTWSLLSPPAGIELQSFTLPRGETRGTLSIRVGADTVPGPYTLTLQGKNGTVTKQATVAVTVGKPGDLVVNWVVPTPGKAYTRGPLLLQFTVEGGAAEQVEILKDTTVLVKPTGSPYSFTWDTTSEAEGTYQLSIRATRGGAAFVSAPRTVIVDRTAPTVASFLPARDAATVSVHDAIQVTFSEPMNPNSVTESAVGLKTGTGAAIAKSVALSADGKTLTVTPLSALSAPSSVQVDLTAAASALTDLAGNGVAAAPTWSFSVPTWLPLGGAVSAVAGRTSADDVVLKMDRNDQPTIAWTESDGASKNIYVARWGGASWSILGRELSGLAGTGSDAIQPTLLIDSLNRPVVAWRESANSGGIPQIFVRRWTGDGWEHLPSIPVYSDDWSISQPSLALDSNGTLHLYALGDATGIAEIGHYSLSAGSQSWARTALPRPPMAPRVYSLATATFEGDTYIAYSIRDTSMYDDGVPIGISQNDSTPMGNQLLGRTSWSPSIAVDSNGRPWTAWAESPSNPSSDGRIQWSRWEGTNWTSPQTIDSSSTGNTEPALAMSTGTPYILAWSGIIGAERNIFISRWIAGNWQPVAQSLNAVTSTGSPATKPSVAMDSNGRPLIAWTEEDATAASIYAFRLNI
ncbi:Ig-like domain-containing protein [Corallococcus interemptor]|nr:Ig-like domain-containing protein [Corallococcus interemptor]